MSSKVELANIQQLKIVGQPTWLIEARFCTSGHLFLLNVLAESIKAKYILFYGAHQNCFPLQWWMNSNSCFVIFLSRNQSRISKQCSFLIIRICEFGCSLNYSLRKS